MAQKGRKPSDLIRVNVIITPEQKRALDKEAKETTWGNFSALVRRILDEHLQKGDK